MKKFLFTLFVLFLTDTAYAENFTNPFYISKKDSLLSTSYFKYEKYHLKETKAIRYRLRSNEIGENIEYGLSDKAALLLSLSNAWTRLNTDIGPTEKENTNFNWSIGGHYDLYHTENYYLQTNVRYLQKETHHYRGAYKALDANIKTGYNLQFIIPYIGVWGQLPIAQSSNSDDKVKCGAYSGVYSNAGIINLDVSVNYDYDRFDWSDKLYMHTALDFLITENISVGGYFNYTLIDKDTHSNKANGRAIAGQIKIRF